MSIPSDSPISSITIVGDASHLLYLHHGYSLETILVSQPLTGDNYNSWSRSMIMVLTVKNKLGLVNGSLTKPESSDDPLLLACIRCNNMVLSWIMNFVSKEIAAGIIYITTAEAPYLKALIVLVPITLN
jgi:uncharacterized protein YfkK (UPF0435 family)